MSLEVADYLLVLMERSFLPEYSLAKAATARRFDAVCFLNDFMNPANADAVRVQSLRIFFECIRICRSWCDEDAKDLMASDEPDVRFGRGDERYPDAKTRRRSHFYGSP